MKETKLHYDMSLVVNSNNGLKMYLTNLEKGKKATPRSYCYKNLDDSTVLDNWMAILNTLESNGNEFEENVFQFDTSQLSKWGPQGGVAPIKDLLEEVVYPTFAQRESPVAFSSNEWRIAKTLATRYLKRCGAVGLRPALYKSVIDDMRVRDTLESNSGFPDFTRRNKPEVIRRAAEDARSGRWKLYPAVALFRNYNQKTRLVWMFPMSANLVEGSFFQPLQSALMCSQARVAEFAPWKGFETVRTSITASYAVNMSIAASDFSSTDAHFGLETSLEVYDVIQNCFQEKYRSDLLESIIRMHTIPLVIGVDNMLVGEHGVSSGSNWTNFIESIFDLIFSYYVSLKEASFKGINLNLTAAGAVGTDEVYSILYAIGDDMSWVVDRDNFDPDFQTRLEAYGREVGQVIKAEKTMNDPDKVKSLQRLFQRGYERPDREVRAVYSTIRALKSIIFPEKFHKPKLWSKDMEAIRDFMILENCVDHPLFERFCKFVADGDPYLRQFARKSTSFQDRQFRLSKHLPGLNTTYNQERRDSSISEFQSVKFLKEN